MAYCWLLNLQLQIVGACPRRKQKKQMQNVGPVKKAVRDKGQEILTAIEKRLYIG